MRLLLFLFIFVASLSVHARSQEYVLKTCSKIYKGDCALIASIAYEESKYQVDAFNPEGSYGLMQVRCSTARMMGFKGECSLLFDPVLNIKYGIKYVESRKNKFLSFTDVIASYNSGSPIICKSYNHGRCEPGQYWNQKYVDKVILKYMVLKLSLDSYTKLSRYP